MTTVDLSILVKLGDRISAPLRSVSNSVSASVARMQAVMQRVSTSSANLAKGLGNVAAKARTSFAILGAYHGALAGLGMSFIGSAAEMERFNVQLTSLEGSSAGAKRAMDWISDFATRTPLELNQTVDAYAKLKAFGVDPMNGSLQAMVDTMAATGGGAEKLDGLVMALGQAWSKGKLQSEEALQMLERGVPVWDLLAEKMGKSAAEVQALATKGKLGREEISLLVDALGERNAGASENMSKTWGGIISNLMDTWTRFQLMVMGAGVFDSLKAKLQGFLTLLNQMAADGRLQAWADTLAENILTSINAIWTFGQAMVDVWQSVYPLMEGAASALGGWDNFIKVIAGGVFVQKLFGLGGALGFVAKAIKIVSMALIANPILAVIAAIAVAAYLIYRNWGAISAWFSRLWANVSATFQRAWGWIKDTLARITPAPIKAAWSVLTAFYATLWQSIQGYFAGFLTFVTGVFSADITRAVTGLQQMWAAAKLALSAVFTAIGSALSLVWTNVIKPVTDKLGMTDAIVTGWAALKDGLATVLDWIGAKFEWLAGLIAPVIDSLRWVKDSGASALNSLGLTGGDTGGGAMPATDASGAAIPQFAGGGDFDAGPIIVGERGPELRYESRGGFIAHNRALREMARISAVIAAAGGTGATAADAVPVGLGTRSTSFNPTYAVSLNVAPGNGSPAEIEAVLRRVLAEQATRAAADARRVLHD